MLSVTWAPTLRYNRHHVERFPDGYERLRLMRNAVHHTKRENTPLPSVSAGSEEVATGYG
jgi:hypothetical protein